jgi:hypothetical protein
LIRATQLISACFQPAPIEFVKESSYENSQDCQS